MTAPLDLDALKAMIERVEAAEQARDHQAMRQRAEAAEREAARFRSLWDEHGKNDLLARAEAAEARLADVLALADNYEACWCPGQQYPDQDPRVQDCPRHGDQSSQYMAEGIAARLRAAAEGKS